MILIGEEDLKRENLNNALDNLSILSDDNLSTLIFCATTILQEREYKREKLTTAINSPSDSRKITSAD